MNISKYSANGNDFVIYHSFIKKDRRAEAIKLCHRQDGIGADGLIVVLPHSEYDFEWQFYNSDGSEADMCGNGSRAVAHYAYINSLAPPKMSFLTGAGVIEAEVSESEVHSAMVLSELTPPKILQRDMESGEKVWDKIDTGVPHLVHFTDDITTFDLKEARALRDKYDANINIAFVEGNNLRVRTYERGVEDETLACGTGMAGCYYMAIEKGLVRGDIEVYPTSGDTLYLGLTNKTITFKGRIKRVFTTDISL